MCLLLTVLIIVAHYFTNDDMGPPGELWTPGSEKIHSLRNPLEKKEDEWASLLVDTLGPHKGTQNPRLFH